MSVFEMCLLDAFLVLVAVACAICMNDALKSKD